MSHFDLCPAVYRWVKKLPFPAISGSAIEHTRVSGSGITLPTILMIHSHSSSNKIPNLHERICCHYLLFMTVNKESFGFGLSAGQKNRFEDVTLGSGIL